MEMLQQGEDDAKTVIENSKNFTIESMVEKVKINRFPGWFRSIGDKNKTTNGTTGELD